MIIFMHIQLVSQKSYLFSSLISIKGQNFNNQGESQNHQIYLESTHKNTCQLKIQLLENNGPNTNLSTHVSVSPVSYCHYDSQLQRFYIGQIFGDVEVLSYSKIKKDPKIERVACFLVEDQQKDNVQNQIIMIDTSKFKVFVATKRRLYIYNKNNQLLKRPIDWIVQLNTFTSSVIHSQNRHYNDELLVAAFGFQNTEFPVIVHQQQYEKLNDSLNTLVSDSKQLQLFQNIKIYNENIFVITMQGYFNEHKKCLTVYKLPNRERQQPIQSISGRDKLLKIIIQETVLDLMIENQYIYLLEQNCYETISLLERKRSMKKQKYGILNTKIKKIFLNISKSI